MKRNNFVGELSLRVGSSMALLVLVALALATSSGVVARAARPSNPPPCDFSDNFYLENGLNPTAILMRVGNADRNPEDWVVDSCGDDPDRRNVRILETTGGFDASGSLIYYSVDGMVTTNTFTNDDAGRRAREIAERFRAFIFPRDPDHDGVVELSPAVPNRRQDNVFDTRGGYFANDPLGLWILAFVVYTEKAFTPEGEKELGPIAAANGVDLDGTPILTSASQIDNLADKGFVKILNRPPSPDVPRWVI